jgi:hypothetical protein
MIDVPPSSLPPFFPSLLLSFLYSFLPSFHRVLVHARQMLLQLESQLPTTLFVFWLWDGATADFMGLASNWRSFAFASWSSWYCKHAIRFCLLLQNINYGKQTDNITSQPSG